MTVQFEPERGVTRYAQLASIFRKRIDSGEWPVGARIPTLDELVAQFRLARTTVRHALGELEAAGLLARQRSRGTFVTARPAARRTVALRTTWSALSEAHGEAQVSPLERKSGLFPPCELAAGERLAPSYVFLKRLHRLEGLPHLVGHVYLDERVAAGIAPRHLQGTAMLRLMGSCRPAVKSARQVMTIDTADLESSALLDIPVNSPVALVDRLMFDAGGTLLCYTRGIYRGDRVRMEIKLK
jgi:GntR family transcriptional regulator